MQLPQSQARENYKEHIRIIEADLKDATLGKKNDILLAEVQKRLDSLAEKYQYRKEIGSARYKLYELQALIYYFNDHDDDALDFINQAIETRGESYTKAENLKKRLSFGHASVVKMADPRKMTKVQRRKQKIGLEGWLALFTVGIMLSILLYFIAAILWINNLSNLSSVSDTFAESLLAPYYGFSIFTSFAMAALATWLLYLLFKWKRLARWIGITLLSLSVLISFIDYAWYASLLTQLSGLESQRGNASIFWSIVWIIYLCVSKRVKRTLTK